MSRLTKKSWPPRRLLDLLDSLAQELITAPDQDLQDVAQELGMDLRNRQSSAYAGLFYPSKPTVADFFDLEVPSLQSERHKLPSMKSRKPTHH